MEIGDIGVTSKAFDDGDRIPDRYTCNGDDVCPALSLSGVPDDAETLALILDDPDAPGQTFTHWLIWNVPADRDGFPENVPKRANVEPLGGAVQGQNDFGRTGYGGPCPPKGDDDHRYRFTLFALSERLDLDPGASRDQLETALEGSVLDTGRLVGTYSRS